MYVACYPPSKFSSKLFTKNIQGYICKPEIRYNFHEFNRNMLHNYNGFFLRKHVLIDLACYNFSY